MDSFLAGTFSGTCSTTLFQPFELLKTRLQMLSANQSKPVGMLRIAVDVVRTESVFALWRGLCPSLYKTVPGIGFYFSALHSLTHHLGSAYPLPAAESMIFGATARSIAAFGTIPLSVVKTRYESGVFPYRSVTNALSHIYETEGLKGLCRGLSATLLRDAPFSAFYLMFYNQLKFFVHREGRIQDPNNPGVFFLCGVVAGCLTSVITHPPDVMKTYMQLYPDQFSRMQQTILHILKNDGFRGFFRGLLPRLIRKTLMAAMSWTVYEQAMILLRIKS